MEADESRRTPRPVIWLPFGIPLNMLEGMKNCVVQELPPRKKAPMSAAPVPSTPTFAGGTTIVAAVADTPRSTTSPKSFLMLFLRLDFQVMIHQTGRRTRLPCQSHIAGSLAIWYISNDPKPTIRKPGSSKPVKRLLIPAAAALALCGTLTVRAAETDGLDVIQVRPNF